MKGNVALPFPRNMSLLAANQSAVVMAVSQPTVAPLTAQLNLVEDTFDLLWTLRFLLIKPIGAKDACIGSLSTHGSTNKLVNIV